MDWQGVLGPPLEMTVCLIVSLGFFSKCIQAGSSIICICFSSSCKPIINGGACIRGVELTRIVHCHDSVSVCLSPRSCSQEGIHVVMMVKGYDDDDDHAGDDAHG